MNHFHKAGTAAIKIAEAFTEKSGSEVIVVRDLLGRNALALRTAAQEEVDELRNQLVEDCAPFLGADPVLLLDEMIVPELITESDDLRQAPHDLAPSRKVHVLERNALSSDWIGEPIEPAGQTPRIALYGFKGGVTRSTATFMLAQHLAAQGKIVLVIDLDLESPGISGMLAPDPDQLPAHGVIDHLIEYPLNNADDLDLTVRSTAVGALGSNGEVWLAPAAGKPTELGDGYLDKLSRVYFDLPADTALERGKVRFAERFEAALQACEQQVAERSRPVDIVLLDSRSGIHDIAAVAITQLSTLALLFATDNTQTWNGYRQLFQRWGQRLDPNRRHEVRQKLQMVAPLVPRDANRYLERFTDESQQCFAATLYDNDEPGDSFQEVFNFSLADETAPHFPIPIKHFDDLVGYVPGSNETWNNDDLAQLAYRDFVSRVSVMIESSNDD